MKKKQKNSKKYIILDFDGVCTSFKEGSYRTNTIEMYGPSKTICERIRQICNDTGARIIISSNWRNYKINSKLYFMRNLITNPLSKLKKELGDLIDGSLPPSQYITKAEALILWFEEHDDIDKWVILDDDPSENLGITQEFNIKDNYIQTNPEFGLTKEIAEEIRKRLGDLV